MVSFKCADCHVTLGEAPFEEDAAEQVVKAKAQLSEDGLLVCPRCASIRACGTAAANEGDNQQ